MHAILKARCDVFIIEQNCVFPDIDDNDLIAMHRQQSGCRVFADPAAKFHVRRTFVGPGIECPGLPRHWNW